jgi:hypothetical protein
MKKIFLVYSDNDQLYDKFVTTIGRKIPNIVSLNYYNIVGDTMKPFMMNKLPSMDQVNKFESYLVDNHKKGFFLNVLDKIEDRDSPRTILFINCANKTMNYHIKRKYPKTCETLKLHLVENTNKTIRNYTDINFDVSIDVPTLSEKHINGVIKLFHIQHIPNFNFINN